MSVAAPSSTNSIFSHIYSAVVDRITTNVVTGTGDSAVPVFGYIAQDFGQLEAETIPSSVTYPGILLDFESTTYGVINSGVQTGSSVLLLRIFTDPYSDDDNLVLDDAIALTLAFYNYEALVHSAIYQWTTNFFSKMLRVSVVTEKRSEDLLRVRQLRYSFSFTDDSTQDTILAPVSPIINVQVNV